jgi:signal transduction histidine kinase/putative methionine-R-sulfoxide reductase with GAF domain
MQPESTPTLTRLSELSAALEREQRISKALREVGNALGEMRDLDDLLELILSHLAQLVEADRATLYLLDERQGELISRIVVGQQVRSIRMKVGHGIAGCVAQTGVPIRVGDAYQDDRFDRSWDALTGYRTKNMLAAPLKNYRGQTIGVIQVLNKTSGGDFTVQDEEMMNVLSTQAAVAVDNSRLLLSLIQKNKQLLETKEQLERRLGDQQLLLELERATGRADSLEALVSAALSLVLRACDAQGGVLQLAEEETGDLVQYVFDPDRAEALQPLGVKAGEGFLSAAMNARDPIRVGQAAEDPRYSERVEGQYSFPVRSVLAVPLEGEAGALGAMGLFSKRGGRDFDAEDEALASLVSANVTTAVRLFRASAARERSERLTTIGRLLSQVIHDFKTPMTVISGYVQLMQDTENAARRAEYAELILKQFDQLTAMQREVLEFARGQRSIFVRRVYLKKFFADVRQQLLHEIGERPIEVKLDIDTKLVARFDEVRVARAVFNLLRNAIEAMADRGGRLTIRAALEDDELTISVSDTGPGVPKEIEGRLFQSFVTAGKQGGTGLGLAIVRKIVDEHGGRIEVTSSSQGATFTLRLPQPPPSEWPPRGPKTELRSEPAEAPASEAEAKSPT